jgi:Family of unknown function (DUF5678)
MVFHDASAELSPVLARIRHFLEEGDVEGARSLIQEIGQRWPDAEDVRYWLRVLAPAKVKVRHGERGRPLGPERAWLREHAHEHPGCWLAIHGDELVAADRDLEAVLKRVRQTPGAENALLYFQPVDPE